MDTAAKLSLLKQDLQLITNSQDNYLGSLLELAAEAITTEGIDLVENDIQCDMLVVQYAAYLFRKRAATETTMPRFLRWQLNNMIFSQKGREDI